MEIKPLYGCNYSSLNQSSKKKLSKPQGAPSFTSFSSIDSGKFVLALKGMTFAKVEKQELNHRLIEVIDHPAYGTVQHFEIFDPANDSVLSRQSVYIVENHELPLVTFATNFKTGAKNENESNNGISHFLEHMVFKGPFANSLGMVNRSVKKQLAGMGAKFNAHTTFDNTYYDVCVPREKFAEAMKIHANMLIDPAIASSDLEKERQVVLEEINRVDNDPFRSTLEKISGELNTAQGSVKNVAGPTRNIFNLTREDLIAYHKKHYGPSNRQIIIMGDVTPEEALKEVKSSYFADKKLGSTETMDDFVNMIDAPVVVNEESAPSNSTERDAKFSTNMSYSMLGLQGPAASSYKEHACLTLTGIILNNLLPQEINKLLPPEKKVFKAGVCFDQLKNYSNIIFYAIGNPEHNKDIQAALNQAIKNIVARGVSQSDLDNARQTEELLVANSTENPIEAISSLSRVLSLGSFTDASNYYNVLGTITPADLQAIQLKYVNPDQAKILNVLPKETTQNQVVQKSAQPNASTGISFTGEFKRNDNHTRLNNGTDLVVCEKPGSHLSSISFVIKGGNRADTKTAQIKMLEIMLKNSGTLYKNNADFSKELETNGIKFDVKSDAEKMVLTATCPSRNKEKMIQLISEIITAPAFISTDPASIAAFENEFRKQKDVVKNIIAMSQNTASNVAVDKLIEALYPEGHSYGLTDSRILSSMDQLTMQDMRDAYYATFAPCNMTVAVVGDVKSEDVRNSLSSYLASLNDHNVILKANLPSKIDHDIVIATPKEGVTQADIYKAWKAPGIKDKDISALYVLLAILGKGNNSRLFNEFREKRSGLCYSVNANLMSNVDDGYIQFYVGTALENIKVATDIFDKEVYRVKTKKVLKEELEEAKAIIKTELILSNSKSEEHSKKMATKKAFGVDTYKEILEKLDKVTEDDVMRVANEYFSKPSVTSIVAPELVLKVLGYLNNH